MKIRTKIRIGCLVIGLLVIAFTGTMFYLVSGVTTAYTKQQVAEKIAEGFFQSAALRSEYVQYPGERPKTQWIHVFDRQKSLFSDNEHLFSEEPEKALFEKIRAETAERLTLFETLVRLIESGSSPTVIQEMNNQLTIRSENRISQALRLADLSRQSAEQTARTCIVIAFLLAMLLLWISIFLYHEGMRIARDIRVLDGSARGISGGDLSRQIPVTRDDELGTVAASFNEMARRLQHSHDDLEQQIAKKTADLRQANAFLDSIIENIPNMLFLKDAKELRFVRFNKAGEELLGHSRQDLLGKNDYDFFPKEQADFFTAKDRHVLEGHAVVDIPQEPIDTRDRGQRILHTKKIPILDAKGQPQYLLGISEDITDVRREEAKIEAILGALDKVALVSMTDEKGDITYVNSRFLEVSKYTKEELMGRNHRILKSGHQPDTLFEDLWKTIRGGKIWRGDIQNKAKDGTYYWVDTSIAPLMNTKGVPERYISIRFLITEQKLLEESRRHFISMSSHQLRTPLTAIRWAVSQLRSSPALDAGTRELVEKAHTSSRQMAEAINAMLQLTQITEKTLKPQIALLHIRHIVDDVIAMQEQIVKRRNIHFDVQCPRDLTLVTDAALLRESLANIVNNACKYSPSGGTVTIAAGKDERGGVRIVVQDSGCGIPADEQKNIGTIFFRAENVLDSTESGTGIGLHLVYALVQLLQGTVTVTSAENAGTTVVLSLPPLSASAPSA